MDFSLKSCLFSHDPVMTVLQKGCTANLNRRLDLIKVCEAERHWNFFQEMLATVKVSRGTLIQHAPGTNRIYFTTSKAGFHLSFLQPAQEQEQEKSHLSMRTGFISLTYGGTFSCPFCLWNKLNWVHVTGQEESTNQKFSIFARSAFSLFSENNWTMQCLQDDGWNIF